MALDVYRKNINTKNQPREINEEDILKKIITSKNPLDPLEILGERSFNQPRKIPKEEIGTPVQEFYRDATIFITGGTGFMGKILTEKLLRACPHVKQIYLLVRNKKGKSSEERIQEIFQDRLFKRLKYEVPNFYQKVAVMNGNLEEPGLGLSEENKKKFAQEVNIVFHGAATVRFDEKLNLAIGINVMGTREIINLAKTAKNLKVIMHVSTAYSFCPLLEIEEKFYDLPVHYEDVIAKVKAMNDDEIYRDTNKILGMWPNTYTFTKAIAECVVKNESQGLPIGVFRPSVIISTYREPVRGWIDNVYGPIGVIVGVATGIIHVYEGDPDDSNVDMVPVDLVVNTLICAAKETSEVYQKNSKTNTNIPIYLCSRGADNPITWRDMIDYSLKYAIGWPTVRAVWFYSLTFTNNKHLYTILSFLFHTIPGYILDCLAVLTGQEPQLTKIYKKMNAVRETLRYFRERTWTFKNENIQRLWKSLSDKDKELFFFNMSEVSWEYYLKAMCLGLRIYLVNDDIHTLPAARTKYTILYYAHNILRCLFYGFIIFLFWTILAAIFLR